MDNFTFTKGPFKTIISFHKVIENLEKIAVNDIDYQANYAKALLEKIAHYPELREGITDLNFIKEHEEIIHNLLADLFPSALTNNEIKAVSIPFQNVTFNYSERFKKILRNAGVQFDMEIRDLNDDQFYILNCILILNSFYGQNFDFNKPLFYDIPDARGVMFHYRILFNADFIEIIPTQFAPKITPEDINLLMNNYDDIELWKEKFPLQSWILKGFAIVSLVDVTRENALSNLKSNLLRTKSIQPNLKFSFESIFQSFFKIPDLKIGFILYDEEEEMFTIPPYNDQMTKSHILSDSQQMDCKNSIYGHCFKTLLGEKKNIIISDVEEFSKIPANEKLAQHLLRQNIHSCIFAPVIKDNAILGIIEVVSSKPKDLNSINAINLDLVLPYLVDTLEHYKTDKQNQIEAIIQREYTAIHSSVYWKFKREALKYFNSPSKDYIFKEIIFKEVYPLYGQIDIKGSSEHRNQTVKEDLKNQLQTLISIFESQKSNESFVLLEQRIFELQSFYDELDSSLKADTEQQIQNYIETEIHPILRNTTMDNEHEIIKQNYFDSLDEKTGMFYHSRKKFDNTMSIINKKLAVILDKKQIEAQQIYPHYYERFKTDGVEHNLYIGASISPAKPFDYLYLNNLRLWQLQTLCEMELAHHQLKATLPYELDVTSLILVFSSPISIRFRMDEKRFDVDGTYNARYEVVKKRIDKATIKGTKERITQKEKITIVYSHNSEQNEYLKYIKYLQFKKILEPNIEQFEVEELQGVSGLRAIRVKVINTIPLNYLQDLTYQDLIEEQN
ncbi:GAF domain-containing protein [Flavobacterium sp.]|uniref:GAF domain-containing protein n=1 Tax=Flavobacterium sp. TaxID=239 RepID=UPI002CDFD800|nr:GAF domain-containing protein [Flavobacterium sp.]HSD06847.1 GAF domain-containing protein [Flavobacterium sp.]